MTGIPTPPPIPVPAGTLPWYKKLKDEWEALPTATLHRDDGRSAMWAIGIAFLLFFTLAQDLLQYGDASKLAGIGTLIGAAALSFDAIFIAPGRKRQWLLFIAFFSGVFGVILMVAEVWDMKSASDANDQRCMAIERDMLSAHRRLANAPDVYQALRCTPSRTDPRIYVLPTDRETRAGHTLPGGGYYND